MNSPVTLKFGASRALAISAVVALLFTTGTDARVTKIVIESTLDPDTTLAATGPAGAIKRISGRAYGELDPSHPGNAIIQDISLAPKNAAGKVEYVSTFQLIMPSDPAKMSGLMWHDVPNRGGRLTIVPAERNVGDVGLSSGWQGENAGNTAYNKPGAEFVIVPVAKNADGSPIRGEVLGRIVNRSGPNSQPLMVQVNQLPYKPFDLDTKKATLTVVKHETVDGKVTIDSVMPSSDWAWAKCDAANPFPGTPDATQICLKNGFNPKLLYQVVFTAQDPPVLGIGFAAFRDVASFFRNETKDDFGTANPLAGKITHVISRGNSQSGNYLRGFIHLGFNQDEAGRQVHDGAWPIIAGRRIALNFRWAQADGVLELYQAGSEGPQWWVPWPDTVRKLPERGILDRCTATKTCPKVIEHFGSAEVWALKLTPEWVGTDGKADIPLPENVRRYYIASSNHGGYIVPTPNTMFNASLAGSTLPAPSCPGNNFGTAVLAPNVMPHIHTVNALRQHFRNWVMKGVAPPPSVWPRLDKGELVDATKAAMGFPTIPGIPATLPSNFIMPTFDYDWGPDFNANDGSGVPTKLPPPIKQVINMKVPRVNADGNEVGGVPVVLHDAPLGTYLGWNITAGGARPFHEGQICNYVGGMVPFAKTKADRVAANDSRLSLEERYTDHAGYVNAVRKAAANAVAQRFLLQADADALIAQADASNVLRP
ncbi:MAG: alpha/beta hydrolase domain-containing protein [Casimicrobium sp.]